ncbi:hypothetical protein CBL_13454 [Carabus blaptoides fortunei]
MFSLFRRISFIVFYIFIKKNLLGYTTKMSEQKTTISSISRDVYIKCRKLTNNAKIPSGILERYTYKTDTGKLLTSASLDKSCTQGSTSGQPYPTISEVCAKLEKTKVTNLLGSKFLKTHNRKAVDTQPSVSIYKVGNPSKDNKVRTEHCDSTTDIVEYLEKKDINAVRALATDNYKSQSCTLVTNAFITPTEMPTKPSPTIHIDSDSDCEIVEIKQYEENEDETSAQASETGPSISINGEIVSPRTKILNRITKPDPVILVISDSDDEESGKQKINKSEHNAILDTEFFTFLCEKTGLQRRMPRIDGDEAAPAVCHPIKMTDAIDFHTLGATPRTSSMIYPRMSVAPTLDKCADDKESVEMINEKYIVVKNKLSPFKSGTLSKPSTSRAQPKSPEFWLHSPKRELSPPCNDTTQQRASEPLSPETMKSEFYKYLKINTNPLAQKTAAVTQNRRSNRVKNLILQIEKAKELDSIRNEYEKPSVSQPTDIRKKYLTYTQPKLVFPSPSLEYNQIIDFEQSFTNYARQERLNYEEPAPQRPTKRARSGIRKKQNERSGQKGHLLRRPIVTKKKKLIIRVQKNQMGRNLLIGKKQDNCLETARRIRRASIRILRNTSSRITRVNTDTFKTINAQKFKISRSKLQVILKKNSIDTSTNNEEQKPLVSDILIEIPKITDNQTVETKQESEPDLSIILKQEPVSPLKSDMETNSTLPNILAKKLSEALHKHKQNENIIPERIPKVAVKSVEKLNVEIPIENVLSVAERNAKESSPPKENIALKILDCIQASTACPSASNTSTNLNEELMAPSETIEIPVVQVKQDIKSENDSGTCQSGSSTRDLFLGFTCEEEKLYDPLLYKGNFENYDCLGFSHDENSTRINNLMQEIITHLSASQIAFEPVVKTEPISITESSLVIPSIIVTESSDTETSVKASGSIDSSLSSSGQEEAHAPIVVVDPKTIRSGKPDYIPLNRDMKIKSLHTSLMYASSKCKSNATKSAIFELSDSDSSTTSPKTPKGLLTRKSTTHEIDINRNDGAVFNAYYVDDILIIVQVKRITFWKQTALGNILGVQNMWMPRGNLERIILDPGCVNRRSSEMTMSVDNAVAYMELWTKEHKCCYRECPIADVFATIYFQKGNSIPDKKVIQLENIKGYGDDVRFAVVRSSREIIVSWCDTFSKPIKSVIRSYQLAPDFQTVASVKEMETVPHYVSSIHNIHDCHNLILGAGNDQISLWNLKHGYLVMTLNMSDTPIQPLVRSNTICLYAQCNTAFLFLIQQTEIGVLRLVAVNGMTHEWKQLHSYQVPDTYDKLLGVIVESGVLMTCYTNGFLCWNMSTGEILSEIDTGNQHIVLPSNKYLVAIDNYQVNVQHIMAYILTHDW